MVKFFLEFQGFDVITIGIASSQIDNCYNVRSAIFPSSKARQKAGCYCCHLSCDQCWANEHGCKGANIISMKQLKNSATQKSRIARESMTTDYIILVSLVIQCARTKQIISIYEKFAIALMNKSKGATGQTVPCLT